MWDLEDFAETREVLLLDFELPGTLSLSQGSVEVEVVVGAGVAKRSKRLFTYALSALATGSPSFTKLRNKLFRSSRRAGVCSGSNETGGVPKVTQ